MWIILVFKKMENLESLRFVYMLYLLLTPLEETYSTPAPSSPRLQLHFPLTLLRSAGSVVATPPWFNSCISPTAWKVSNYRVFSGPYYRAFGPENTPYLDTFHAVPMFLCGASTIKNVLHVINSTFTGPFLNCFTSPFLDCWFFSGENFI